MIVGAGDLALAGSNKEKKGKQSPDAVFQKHDKDSDGKLTVDEFKGSKTGSKAARAEKKFQKLDTNGDGAVTRDEFKTPKGKKGDKKTAA